MSATKRARRGMGGVRNRKRGLKPWEARWTDDTGKARSSYHSTEREAQQALVSALSARQQGLPVPGRQSLASWLDEWLETYVSESSPATQRLYAGMVRRHLQPELGRIALTDLRDVDIKRLHRSMAKQGLSPRTIRTAHAALSSALTQAVRSHRLARNVAQLVTPPSSPPRVDRHGEAIRVPTDDELRQLLEAVAGDDLEPLYRLAIGTGIRQGEALGLRWADVDLSHALTGRRCLVRVNGTLDSHTMTYGPTKTRASVRAVPVAERLCNRLADHKRRMAAYGRPTDDGAYVFSADADGSPVSAHRLRHHLERSCRAAGIPLFKWHALRHWHATKRIGQGDDLVSVSRSLGHSRVSTTTDLYTHSDGSNLKPLDELDTPANVVPISRKQRPA